MKKNVKGFVDKTLGEADGWTEQERMDHHHKHHGFCPTEEQLKTATCLCHRGMAVDEARQFHEVDDADFHKTSDGVSCYCGGKLKGHESAVLQSRPKQGLDGDDETSLSDHECVEGDGNQATHLHGGRSGQEPCCGQHDDCADY